MSNEMKDQLKFAIFSAETQRLDGQHKLNHIIQKMKAKYGGNWAGFYCGGWSESAFLIPNNGESASFNYDGKNWVIFKYSNFGLFSSSPHNFVTGHKISMIFVIIFAQYIAVINLMKF